MQSDSARRCGNFQRYVKRHEHVRESWPNYGFEATSTLEKSRHRKMSDVSLNPQGSSVTPTGAEGGEMETLRAELAASQAANEKLRHADVEISTATQHFTCVICCLHESPSRRQEKTQICERRRRGARTHSRAHFIPVSSRELEALHGQLFPSGGHMFR